MHSIVFGSLASRKIVKRLLPYLVVKKADAEAALRWERIPKFHRKNSPSKHPKYAEVMRRYRAGESAWKISRETGVKDATISYWVRTAGISRSLSEAQLLRRRRETRAI